MPRSSATASLVFAAIALLFWLLMFGAGTDVWHDTGRLDIWHLEGPPYADLRVFGVVFYLLLPVLVAQCVIALVHVLRLRSLKRA
jgi:hypothetical protein